MLKETDTEETIVFFGHIFIISSVSIGGGPARRVVRIWKRGGGGAILKEEKSANNLDPNFYCS